MKTFLLYFLCCPLLLMAQQEPISISRMGDQTYGVSDNSFAKRFRTLGFLNVHVSQPHYYHQRNIKKLELLQRDNTLFYSIDFDSSGRVLQETIKGDYFYISKQLIADSIRQRDTLILSYVRESRLMRVDTIVTQHYRYQNKDTLMSFSRQYSTIWYNGALINEQNEYYNRYFLNRKIALQQSPGSSYHPGPAKNKAIISICVIDCLPLSTAAASILLSAKQTTSAFRRIKIRAQNNSICPTSKVIPLSGNGPPKTEAIISSKVRTFRSPSLCIITAVVLRECTELGKHAKELLMDLRADKMACMILFIRSTMTAKKIMFRAMKADKETKQNGIQY